MFTNPKIISVNPDTTTTYTVTMLNGPFCSGSPSNTVTLDVKHPPLATAGGSQTICQNATALISGASASNGNILWTHNGTGTISDETTISPMYTPGLADTVTPLH